MNLFGSLRTRLLVPLVVCSILAGIVVGLVSYTVSSRQVRADLEKSFQVIRQTLQRAQFPLTPAVLRTLAALTETELVTYDAQGRPLAGSSLAAPHPIDSGISRGSKGALVSPQGSDSRFRDTGFREDLIPGYLVRTFSRETSGSDRASQVLVLVDAAKLRRAELSAALFPLATGLCATIVLAVVASWLSQRMIARIGQLRIHVGRVAAGDFSPAPLVAGEDELAELGVAIGKMSDDLQSLWQTVHQQERQKLIHQLAAGMAHQLRNSLTGARMAIDLHAQQNPDQQGQALDVAKREIRRTEDYVQRILSLAAQQQLRSQPGPISPVLEPLEESLQIIARHHRVTLAWSIPEHIASACVADPASLGLGLENLVLNAIEAGGDYVSVDAKQVGQTLQFEVADNGPGPPENLAEDHLFEPFMTSKPEGLGLGLSLVRRAAEMLGGEVSLSREQETTRFRFVAQLVSNSLLAALTLGTVLSGVAVC